MYDEEYFIQVLKPIQQAHDLDNSLFYKYYTELSDAQLQAFETNHIDNMFASERGTVLGISLPNCNPWLSAEDNDKPKQCLIKLYDSDIRAFKLNDVVTFMGVLEFSDPKQSDEDTHMMQQDEGEEFRTGIPNERMLP